MQCYGPVCEVQELEPFADKWRSFGFNVKEVDGHDTAALRNILKNTPFDAERPQVVICHTVKGKGIHSLEGHAPSHHKSKIADEEMEIFIKELEQC
jgi:transketolase